MPGISERLLYRVAKRWIAGYTLDEALVDAQHANEKQMNAIVNRLGEHTPNPKLIADYTQEYLRLLDSMESRQLRGAISVKPSQLGLTVEKPLFEKNLEEILEKANTQGRDVWVDMEQSKYTTDTISVYKSLFQNYKDFGQCLQANLRRTEKDLPSILGVGGRVRLVKGAYPEPSEIAFKRKSEVDENYLKLLDTLFESGQRFVVGTHDDKLIDKAEQLSREHKVDFEFEFLKGIRDDLKDRLTGKGYNVGEYIPYGPEWYNYSKRRIRERKRNILLLLRSITG